MYHYFLLSYMLSLIFLINRRFLCSGYVVFYVVFSFMQLNLIYINKNDIEIAVKDYNKMLAFFCWRYRQHVSFHQEISQFIRKKQKKICSQLCFLEKSIKA